MKVPDAPVCVGREDVMPLPDDVYTKPFSLTDGSLPSPWRLTAQSQDVLLFLVVM